MARASKNGIVALIYSTLTNATEYAHWEYKGSDLPHKVASVVIDGGAGLVHKKAFITPLGKMTEVDEAQLALLEANGAFQQHVEGGWITVVRKTAIKADADGVAADMSQRDGSAPLVPYDFSEPDKVTHGKTLPDGTEPTKRSRSIPLPHLRQQINAFR